MHVSRQGRFHQIYIEIGREPVDDKIRASGGFYDFINPAAVNFKGFGFIELFFQPLGSIEIVVCTDYFRDIRFFIKAHGNGASLGPGT